MATDFHPARFSAICWGKIACGLLLSVTASASPIDQIDFLNCQVALSKNTAGWIDEGESGIAQLVGRELMLLNQTLLTHSELLELVGPSLFAPDVEIQFAKKDWWIGLRVKSALAGANEIFRLGRPELVSHTLGRAPDGQSHTTGFYDYAQILFPLINPEDGDPGNVVVAVPLNPVVNSSFVVFYLRSSELSLDLPALAETWFNPYGRLIRLETLATLAIPAGN